MALLQPQTSLLSRYDYRRRSWINKGSEANTSYEVRRKLAMKILFIFDFWKIPRHVAVAGQTTDGAIEYNAYTPCAAPGGAPYVIVTACSGGPCPGNAKGKLD